MDRRILLEVFKEEVVVLYFSIFFIYFEFSEYQFWIFSLVFALINVGDVLIKCIIKSIFSKDIINPSKTCIFFLYFL